MKGTFTRIDATYRRALHVGPTLPEVDGPVLLFVTLDPQKSHGEHTEHKSAGLILKRADAWRLVGLLVRLLLGRRRRQNTRPKR